MELKPIITSLLETDQYKLNMQSVFLHQFNKDITKWVFKCRNTDIKFTPEMIQEIKDQIDYYCTLQFTDDELKWLSKNLPWLKEDYINYLSIWKPNRNQIHINDIYTQCDGNCGLAIECEGPQVMVTMYEIPILAIVSEVYYAFKYGVGFNDIEFQKKTIEKFDKIVNGIYDIGNFSEFGLRRRYSSDMQDWLIKYIVDQKIPGFVGTSNVYLAKKYGIKAVGTMAHSMFQLMQGHREYNPAYTNMLVMKAWVKEFETDNGIILTDAITTDCFLKDFNKTYATLFSGCRHDSGDPLEWGDKLIAHYEMLGINPKNKTLLFSDSLNFEKATEIRKYFKDRCNVAFGIGTFLSSVQSDTIKPLNIVHKMIECNGGPVAKISDCEGKGMCRDANYIDYLKRSIDWRLRYDK